MVRLSPVLPELPLVQKEVGKLQMSAIPLSSVNSPPAVVSCTQQMQCIRSAPALSLPLPAAFPVPMSAFTAPMSPPAFTSDPTWSGGSYHPYAAPSAHVASHHCPFRYCLVCGHQVSPTSGQKNYCSKQCSEKGPLLCKACNRQRVTALAWLGSVPAPYRPFKDQCYRFCCLDCFKSSIPTRKCNSCGQFVPSCVQSRSGAYYCMDCSNQLRAADGI